MRILGLPFLVFCVASLALFALFPRVDLAFTGLFYDDGFHLARHPFALFLHRYAGYPGIALGLAGLSLWLVALLLRRRRLLGVQRGVGLFLGLALILGPGLVVNGLLKDHWGRARPAQIQEFGGERQFTPALVIAGECERNCAFTSGHAAIAFYLVALAFLLRGVWRHAVFSGAVLYGVAVGLVRIVQGGHFLSDVVFSFIVVYLASAVLYWLFVGVRRDSSGVRRQE
jgi:lipid A 4'-phosphatase